MSRSLAAIIALVLIGDIFIVMAAVAQYRGDEALTSRRQQSQISAILTPAPVPRATIAGATVSWRKGT
jgi:hypothetical protein